MSDIERWTLHVCPICRTPFGQGHVSDCPGGQMRYDLVEVVPAEQDGASVPAPPETWPIIEHEPEHIPVVPPELDPRVPANAVEAMGVAAANPVHDDGHTDCYYAGLLRAAIPHLIVAGWRPPEEPASDDDRKTESIHHAEEDQ